MLIGLVALARRFPFHAVALQSRIAMLWSKGDARNVDEFFAQIPRLDKTTKEEWREKLDHGNLMITMSAISALGYEKDRTAVGKLVTLLEESRPEYHMPVIEALTKIADPAAAPSVLRFLGHDKEYMREAALKCVRASRNPAALPAVVEQLQREKSTSLMVMGLQTLYDLGAQDGIKAYWDAIPFEAKSAYFDLLYDVTDERLDEMSCFASCAALDTSEEVREKARSLERKMLLHEYTTRYADIFPAKDVVKSAGMDRPRLITLRTDRPLHFEAVDGGYLEVRPGEFAVDLSAQYEHKAKDWDDTDVAAIRIQVSDSQGDIWEAVLRVRASDVFDAILGGPAKQYYGDISEDHRQAFRDHMLLQGLQTLDDSRDCKDILMEKGPIEVYLKYQVPIMDMALYNDNGSEPVCLLVRTFRLIDRHVTEIPPFVSTVPLITFLLEIAAKAPEEDAPHDALSAEKSRFHKVGHGERRQANVIRSQG